MDSSSAVVACKRGQMALRLTKRKGTVNWYFRGSINGVEFERSTRTPDRSEARRIMTRFAFEQQQKLLQNRETITFADAAHRYRSFGKGENRFLDVLVEELGHLNVDEIGQAEIDEVALNRYPGRKASTINRQVYTPVSAVLKHAAASGYCRSIPLRRPKQPRATYTWMREDEARRLLQAASSFHQPLILFLLMTGARSSEAMNLEWREVDLEREWVTFKRTKNGEQRTVPLHPTVVQTLHILLLKGASGRVFRTPSGAPYTPKAEGGGGFKKAFASAARKAGLPHVTPHTCRHTWATWHYQANRNLNDLQALGGWKSVQMVLRYAHANPSGFAEGVGKLPEIGGVSSISAGRANSHA